MSETTDTTLAANGAAMPKAPDVGPTKFIQEIDEYLGQTFDQMTQLDERFEKFSRFFLEQAEEVIGDRDFNKMSKDEQNMASAYAYAALAVEGACAVVKGIKETVALEKVKRLHRTIAENRQESLGRMIERAQRCHDDAVAVLARHNDCPFSVSELEGTFQETADMLENELCQFRDIRFRLDMLLWLQDEYEAWMDNRLYSDTPMPIMGQSTIAAIYILNGVELPVSKYQREKDLKKFGQELKEGLSFTGKACNKDFITSFEMLAMIDSQMGAVLEHASLAQWPLGRVRGDDEKGNGVIDTSRISCKRLYAEVYMNAGKVGFVQDTLYNNVVVSNSCQSLEAYDDIKKEYKDGITRASVNGILLLVVVILFIHPVEWAWYWHLLLAAFLIYLLVRFVAWRWTRRISSRFLLKCDMMFCKYEHSMANRAGLIEPKSKVREMEESRNGFWWGLIIGGVIGLIGGPLGMIFGAIIGAIIGSGSSDEVDTHGEGWQYIKISSPVKQWITAVILVCVIGFEIYALFIR